MPLIIALIKISIEATCFKFCFNLGKVFLTALIHNSYGTEAESFGEVP